mgnify:FL=1
MGSTVINRISDQVRERLEAQPLTDEDIAKVCERYAAELDQSIARVVERDAIKQRIYKLLLAEGADPILEEEK